MKNKIKTNVLVLGAGPGGYSAAFRCADLGLHTVLVERYSNLGGVCLNVGCIPSKALLHVIKVIKEAQLLRRSGIVFNDLQIDINQLRIWKENIINNLAANLSSMAKARKVNVITGYGKFINANELKVENASNTANIIFDNAIIAAGSRPIKLPFVPYGDPRIWNSTDALTLKSVPKHLLVIGGGIIGLEIATIYHTLGSKIDIVEVLDQIIPAADKDVANLLIKHINHKFNLMMKTEIVSIETKEDGLYVSMKREHASLEIQRYDFILIAVGRVPNSNLLDINHLGLDLDDNNFIQVNKQMRTNIPHIYAIGDIVGQPMLAHKSIYESHIAAEVIAGKKYYFDPKTIPFIAYTEPEVAWVGLTEKEAKNKSINYEVAAVPWTASGRAITSNCQDGITKLIFNKKNNRIIGGAVVGSNSSELLGEISLAIEMNCDAEDIALTIHAHPTLYESIGLAAELYAGTITSLLNKINK